MASFCVGNVAVSTGAVSVACRVHPRTFDVPEGLWHIDIRTSARKVPLRKDGVDTMATARTSLERLSAGMYWLSEVRNLAGVPTDLSRRFVKAYKGQRGLWGGAEQREGRYYYATFLDLMELRIVNAFHTSGVSWQRICKTAEYGFQRFGTDFPFSHRRFQTDGKDIFDHSGYQMEQVSRDGQLAFAEIIGPSLFKPMDYVDDAPVRWYPAEEWGLKSVGRNVVVDPRYSFGSPVINERFIPTDTLSLNFEAEGRDASLVARSYEISEASVWCAVYFEQELARRATNVDK